MAYPSRYLADFHVAGMRYWDGALALGKLKPGKKLALVAEPDNAHDPSAVALYYKRAKLGYIPREHNDLASKLLQFGHADVIECRILKVDASAEPWQQVRVGLYLADNSDSPDESEYDWDEQDDDYDVPLP